MQHALAQHVALALQAQILGIMPLAVIQPPAFFLLVALIALILL
jgi:hypothetical protein